MRTVGDEGEDSEAGLDVHRIDRVAVDTEAWYSCIACGDLVMYYVRYELRLL
jgi:hypothetical protein